MSETRAAAGGAREHPVLTPQELRLRAFLRLLAAAFCLGVLGYLLPALFGPFRFFFVNLPFVTNSVVKIGVLALLAFFASGDVRRLERWNEPVLRETNQAVAGIADLFLMRTEGFESGGGTGNPFSRSRFTCSFIPRRAL